MSGRLSPSAVHDRTKANLAEWARSNERSYDEAASILGIGHASAYRRLQGDSSAEWTVRDLVRAICHAERMEDDRRILDGFVRDVRGELHQGQASHAVPAATALVAQLGGEIQALMKRLSNSHIDQGEARDTLADIALLRRSLDDLEAACAVIAAGPRR
jgi:hypothetical protein